jgi:hypothetical protein
MLRHHSLGCLGCLLVPLLLARPAAADVAPVLVLAGRVDAVVSAGDGVAALRDGQAIALDARGRAVGGCRSAVTPVGAAPRPDRTALGREEVLREAGFSDEDVSPEAEELLDDEGLEPPPRRRPVSASSGAPRARALAGAADAVWIATADGLWRLGLGDGACLPAGLGGQEVALVDARGASVMALADATLWRSRDAGATFEVAAVLTSPGHALALAADGETALVADEDGVVEVGAARGVRRRLEGRVDALVTCGADVVALAGDGVHRLDADGRDALAGDRPPVRALACGVEGLVAAGLGVWTSADGARWREERTTLGRSFSSVAEAQGRAWLASERGLEVLEPTDAPPVAGDDGPARPAAPAERHAPAWAGLLPRVAIAFDGWTRSTGVAGWQLWVRATVSLGRRWQRSSNEAQNEPEKEAP